MTPTDTDVPIRRLPPDEADLRQWIGSRATDADLALPAGTDTIVDASPLSTERTPIA